jgi:hypothetical protein
VAKAKSTEEREAEVQTQAAEQHKHTNRISEAQARHNRMSEKRDRNGAAITEYSQQVEAAASAYNPVL